MAGRMMDELWRGDTHRVGGWGGVKHTVRSQALGPKRKEGGREGERWCVEKKWRKRKKRQGEKERD